MRQSQGWTTASILTLCPAVSHTDPVWTPSALHISSVTQDPFRVLPYLLTLYFLSVKCNSRPTWWGLWEDGMICKGRYSLSLIPKDGGLSGADPRAQGTLADQRVAYRFLRCLFFLLFLVIVIQVYCRQLESAGNDILKARFNSPPRESALLLCSAYV